MVLNSSALACCRAIFLGFFLYCSIAYVFLKPTTALLSGPRSVKYSSPPRVELYIKVLSASSRALSSLLKASPYLPAIASLSSVELVAYIPVTSLT